MNNGPKNARWRVVAKSRVNMVLGSLEQAIPEGIRNLSRSVRSGIGGQNEAGRCRSPPPRLSFSLLIWGPIAPPWSYVPITAPIRASQRRPGQGTTNMTTHRSNLWPLYGWASEHPVKIPSNLAMLWSLFYKYCNGFKGSKRTFRTFENVHSL